jgi:hypothetical protein
VRCAANYENRANNQFMQLLNAHLLHKCDATSAGLQASRAEIEDLDDRLVDFFVGQEFLSRISVRQPQMCIRHHSRGLTTARIGHCGCAKEKDMLLLIILILLIFGFGYGGYRVGPGWGYYGGGAISLLLTIVVILLLLKVI